MSLGDLRGRLDVVAGDQIEGWAQDAGAPDLPVRVLILDNGVELGEAMAASYRPDLEQAGMGSGRHGFRFTVPGGLAADKPHFIQAQRAEDRCELVGSPRILDAVAPAMRSHIEEVSRARIAGWAWDMAETDHSVQLRILDNDVQIGLVVANQYRPDLALAGIGDGRHAFELFVLGGLSPDIRHVIRLVRATDGVELAESPCTIDMATRFDAALECTLAGAIDALLPGPAQDRVLDFLVTQAERMLSQRASGEAERTRRLAHRHFLRRWGRTPPAQAAAQAPADPGLRVLVIDSLLPDPNRDAGSQAVLSHMRAFRRLGYAVSFVAADALSADAACAATQALRESMQEAGIAVCHAPFYASVEEVLRRQTGCFDAVYLHRLCNAARYAAIARHHCPSARLIYSVADLHFLRAERQAAIEERPELLGESRRLRLAECTAAWNADAVLTHSTFEAALLRQAVPGARVHVAPWDMAMGVAPWDMAMGVAPWDMAMAECATPFAARHGVAFIGGYAHSPNIDAARYLAEEIMPLVWRHDPAIGCLLVGSDMPDSVRTLARPGIRVLDCVPDLAAVFDTVRLTVAPLRYGAGVKGKVLASFAAGLPCVMSPMAAEGLALPERLEGLVGADAAAVASIIARLHGDPAACHEAGQAGMAFVEAQFCPAAVDAALAAALQGRVAAPGARPEAAS